MKYDKASIAQWIIENDLKQLTTNLTSTEAAYLFLEVNQECFLSTNTIKQYIKIARKGDYTPPVINNISEIAKQMKANQKTAYDAFDLDKNPLGVLDDEVDIKSAFFDVPETYADYKAPLKLDSYGKKLGIVSDIHFPIHDRQSVLAAHAHLKKLGINCLLLMGDIMDLSNLTRHAKRKSLSYTWREELDVTRSYIRSLRVLFPDIPIVYSEGNHENWFQQYIIRQCRDIEGTYILRDMLKLGEHNIEWLEEDRLMTYGDLYLHHGHRFGVGGGVNVATRLLNKHGVNLIVGHFHKEGHDEKRTLDEKVHGVWVNSCLAEVHPDYSPHNNSTHGFSTVDLHDGGNFTVKQYKIINGKVLGE